MSERTKTIQVKLYQSDFNNLLREYGDKLPVYRGEFNLPDADKFVVVEGTLTVTLPPKQVTINEDQLDAIYEKAFHSQKELGFKEALKQAIFK